MACFRLLHDDDDDDTICGPKLEYVIAEDEDHPGGIPGRDTKMPAWLFQSGG